MKEKEKGTSIDQECIALDAAMTNHLVDGLTLDVLLTAHTLGFQNKELESKLVNNLDGRKVWKRNWRSVYDGKVQLQLPNSFLPVCRVKGYVHRRGNHGQ